jgi:hypothetical protein
LWAIRGTKRLKVEGFIYNVEGHQGHNIKDIASTRVKNVFIFYVFELGVVMKHGGKNIEDVGKAQMFLNATKGIKKDFMGVININVLIGQN